jgi:hypothetical protein
LQLESLAYRFEKAGLALDGLPIPWNADAVLVEASVLRPRHVPLQTSDFALRDTQSDQTYVPAETRGLVGHGPVSFIFRLPTPTQRTTVELFWQTRSLGQMTMPVLNPAAFRRQLTIEMPTVNVRLGPHIVPCQTYVSTQGQEVQAAAVLTCESCLAPVVDLDLHVVFAGERRENEQVVPLRLTGTQLSKARALVTASLPKPRRVGSWTATWKIGDAVLASQVLRTITRPHFHRSLRLMDTRFVVADRSGRMRVVRQFPPPGERVRVGPCFVVKSTEPGIAGVFACQIRAQVKDAVRAPLLIEQEVLITDGPNPIAPGTFAADDLEGIDGFELCLGNKVLGVCPFGPAPTASFTSEGGFKSADPFTWSDSADNELNDRLNRLFRGS